MKIVNCALLYADGDKYVWSVVTESASEFPIDMELVADGSIWENDGVKSVLTDGEWVAESSGGGVSFPIFTSTNGSWACDMTYEEAKAVYDSEKGDSAPFCPCHVSVNGASNWDMASYATREQIASATFNPPLPEDLIGGLTFSNLIVYGNDGNFYEKASH